MQLTYQQIQFVEDLLSKMTLKEKIGQMNQESPSIVGGFDVSFSELIEMLTDGRISQTEYNRILSSAEQDYHEDDIRKGFIGSIMGNDPRKANELQRIAVEESRLGIPLIIGFDVIHGLRSVYPIALAEACSFDDELFEQTAHMAAKESRAYGISWDFAPMLDVARDARWGRISEGPGEDPCLGARFARAKIRGLQNDTTNTQNYVAACIKHFAAYGACEGGRDYNTTSVPTALLYNVYLPNFRAAIEEGAATAMAAFNDLNGIPCTVHKELLQDILKDEMKLRGFVVSDANAIKECVLHGIAKDDLDAGIQAVLAGIDMDMGTHIYKDYLYNEVENGNVPIQVIDEAVRRILSVKVWLGLFENPYIPEETILAYEKSLPAEHIQLCRKAAEESIVLLKNEGNHLPIQRHQRISLVGYLGNNTEEICGAWAMGWEEKDCISIFDGLKNIGADVSWYGCIDADGNINNAEIRQACECGDVIVAVVGERSSMSGEAASRAEITIPESQRNLLQALLDAGKPVITVLMNGRPLALGWEAENLPAILEAWQLGIRMGDAVASVLMGDVNPSGKLSVSFPAVTGQCPVYYNHLNTGRPGSKSKYSSRYMDAPVEPIFPFGYGLSYTDFSYSDLTVIETDASLNISVKLKNTGSWEGTEIVQLYMQDVAASLVRPVKELKDYRRVCLKPGEECKVCFELKKKDMGFYNNLRTYCLESGLFRIYVGSNSRDLIMNEIDVHMENA